ncbi:hypothetical protein ACHAW5_002552 [Stephanodiscus triporus]|uniref:PWI domain-containing protein n=1 Tax=Stephanodiscus triporus TaxID=2934178 RepID=A0ABD3MW76_9STRA
MDRPHLNSATRRAPSSSTPSSSSFVATGGGGGVEAAGATSTAAIDGDYSYHHHDIHDDDDDPRRHTNLNLHPQNFAQTVVLCRLPPFLRSVRSLRDVAYVTGSARTVHVGCCPPSNDVDARRYTERGLPPSTLAGLRWGGKGGGGGGGDDDDDDEDGGGGGGAGGIAVVKLGHYGGARDFAGGIIALSRCGREGRLPDDNDDDNDVGNDATTIKTTTTTTTNGDAPVEADDADAAPVDDDEEEEEEKTKADREAARAAGPRSSKYDSKEEAMHLETLRQMRGMRAHHLFSHHVPDPVPPDMDVPQPPPVPADPSVPLRLLEALTTLRLRHEASVKEASDLVGGGSGVPSASSYASYANDDQWGGHAEAAGTDDGGGIVVVGGGGAGGGGDHGVDVGMMKMDTAKLAAAAGGVSGYDEEADPLNAPDVIKAVLAFKRRLEDQNAKGKRRRVEIINDRMARKVAELLERGRREREERRSRQLRQQQQQQQQQQQLEGQAREHHRAVEDEETKDTGRRGVSNLPAWMTKGQAGGGADAGNGAAVPRAEEEEEKEEEEAGGDDDHDGGRKRKFVPSEANRDINARRQKLDVSGGGTSLSEIRAANEAADELRRAEMAAAEATPFAVETTKEGILSAGCRFPPLSPSAADPLKRYVTSQIVDYLGEEESTLIEFIMKELSKEGGCTTLSLLEEMKMVLDEESEDFVLGLYRKMLE